MKNIKTEILINASPFETRVALLEEGRLAEFYVERAKDRGITGNIYKGKVVRVLPGMQSAFVEVGLQRTAFLHVTDIRDAFEDEDEEDADKGGKREDRSHGQGRIQDLLKEGQEITVQAAKEPLGTKGSRVTSYVSLPGRHLVFMPTYDKVAISRRISSDRERKRLREIVHSLKSPGHGYIVRTVCEGMDKDEIKADMEFLLRLWKRIQENARKSGTPALIYEELDLTLRIIRDLFSSDVERLVIDSREEYSRASDFVNEFMPELSPKLSLHEGKEDLFDAHGIEIELAQALEIKVWLRSGGYLIIDQMEALTAVDINTGKYVGKRSSDDTILRTNIEAVEETVRQLRLRNIGGIIVIDFIDMARASDREKVYNELKEALKADKAQTNILKISELGIVEMTRKRVRESLAQSLCEPCQCCDGNGLVKAKDTIIMDIYRDLCRELPKKQKKALIYVSAAIAERLSSDRTALDGLEKRFGKKVEVLPVERFGLERYEIY